jgi:hypothetical protein
MTRDSFRLSGEALDIFETWTLLCSMYPHKGGKSFWNCCVTSPLRCFFPPKNESLMLTPRRSIRTKTRQLKLPRNQYVARHQILNYSTLACVFFGRTKQLVISVPFHHHRTFHPHTYHTT